jgi:hypothetical protein
MVKFKIITKRGESAAMFSDKQFKIACHYAELHNGKVINAKTGEVLKNFCKSKHFKKKT